MSQIKTEAPNTSDAYLICDLDGTLLKNDFFVERLIYKSLTKPLTLLQATKGIVHLKHHILDNYVANISSVANEHVIALIKKIAPEFKKAVLISASTEAFVEHVNSQLNIFDECYGTTTINLKGRNKLNFIKEKNYEPFVYIGDSKADNILFENALYYYKIKKNKPVLFK